MLSAQNALPSLRGSVVIRTHDVRKNLYLTVHLQIDHDLDHLLRGTMVVRTHLKHKNLYVSVYLLSVVGPDYYAPTYYSSPNKIWCVNVEEYVPGLGSIVGAHYYTTP